jgi:flagellar hook assembly protein FlgD
MSIYDVRGRMVKVLVDLRMDAGYHSAVWDGRSASGTHVAPGIYFVHLSASGAQRTAKVVLKR